MSKPESRTSGRHFLQIPGPTNIPDRILRAIDRALIDHRGPRFAEMMLDLIERLKEVFKTSGPVIIYPASGSGAWEAALTNTLSPGNRVLAFETGYFATLWKNMAENLGLEVDWIEGDWRRGLDPNVVETNLARDHGHKIKAVLAVHNETSTGVTSRVSEIRQAIDRANHPALFFVDAISSLGCTDYQHDNWGIDVTICGSQKGLMLPPGLSFNALSAKAIEAAEKSNFKKSYWDWKPILQDMANGFFPYTPATGLLYGLSEAVDMLLEEGPATPEGPMPSRPGSLRSRGAGCRAGRSESPFTPQGSPRKIVNRILCPARRVPERVPVILDRPMRRR